MRGEFELIKRYFAPLAEAAPGAQGLRNDGALFDPASGDSLVLTLDAMVAGIAQRGFLQCHVHATRVEPFTSGQLIEFA
jgi:thiamine monophosphate kinase